MSADRISAAEYRALIAAGAKPKSHGSKRGSQGSSVGECAICGGRVGAKDEAWFHTDDVTGESWVKHLRKEDCA